MKPVTQTSMHNLIIGLLSTLLCFTAAGCDSKTNTVYVPVPTSQEEPRKTDAFVFEVPKGFIVGNEGFTVYTDNYDTIAYTFGPLNKEVKAETIAKQSLQDDLQKCVQVSCPRKPELKVLMIDEYKLYDHISYYDTSLNQDWTTHSMYFDKANRAFVVQSLKPDINAIKLMLDTLQPK